MNKITLNVFNEIINSSYISSPVSEENLPNIKMRFLDPAECSEQIKTIQDRINDPELRISGTQDQLNVWNKGWGEIRDNVIRHGISETTLKPQYFNNQRIIRLAGKFAEIEVPDGLFKLDCFLRKIIFKDYLTNVQKVVELGCGTGLNLYLISTLFPEYNLIGADWATPSQDIINSFQKFSIKAEGKNFNLLTPTSLPIDSETAVLTVHALEQIGDQHDKLIEMLDASRPKFILNIEPIHEHYDDGDFDSLAKSFHQKRRYLSGYYTRLKELEKNKKIIMYADFKIKLGSKFHDAYSVLKWAFL